MANEPGPAEESAETSHEDGKVVRAESQRLDRVGGSNDVANPEPARLPAPTADQRLREELAQTRLKLKRVKTAAVAGTAVAVVAVLVAVVVAASSGTPSASGPQSSSSSAPTTSSSSNAPGERTSEPEAPSLPQSAATTPAQVVNTSTATSLRPAPRLHLNGQDDINDGSIPFDFDEGPDSFHSGGDVMQDGTVLSASNGASIAPSLPGTGDEYSRCGPVQPEAYRSHLRLADLKVGDVLCVRTDEGRLAYLEISELPSDKNNGWLDFRWTTWSL